MGQFLAPSVNKIITTTTAAAAAAAAALCRPTCSAYSLFVQSKPSIPQRVEMAYVYPANGLNGNSWCSCVTVVSRQF